MRTDNYLNIQFSTPLGNFEPSEYRAVIISFGYRVNEIPSLYLELQQDKDEIDNRNNFYPDLTYLTKAKKITVRYKSKLIFEGEIESVTLEKNAAAQHDKIVVNAAHAVNRLVYLTDNQIYKRASDYHIISEILKDAVSLNDFQIDSSVAKHKNPGENELVAFRVNRWRFLLYCLNRAGVVLFPTKDKLHIAPLQAVKGGKHYDVYTSNKLINENILDNIITKVRTVFYQHNKLRSKTAKLESFDSYKRKKYDFYKSNYNATWANGIIDPFDATDCHSQSIEYSNSLSSPVRRLMSQYETLMSSVASEAISLRLGVEQDEALFCMPGDSMTLHGLIEGNKKQKATLLGVAHSFSNNEWSSELIFDVDRSTFFLENPSQRIVSTIGIVKQVNFLNGESALADVIIPIFAGKRDNTVSVRLSAPKASKQSGITCFPEKGDQVYLQFIEGDPSHPVMVSAFYDNVNKLNNSRNTEMSFFSDDQIHIEAKTFVVDSGKTKFSKKRL